MSVTFFVDLNKQVKTHKQYFLDRFPNLSAYEEEECRSRLWYKKDDKGYYEFVDAEANAVELQLANSSARQLMAALMSVDPGLQLNDGELCGSIHLYKFSFLIRAAMKLSNSTKLATDYSVAGNVEQSCEFGVTATDGNVVIIGQKRGPTIIDCGIPVDRLRSYGERLLKLVSLCQSRNSDIIYG